MYGGLAAEALTQLYPQLEKVLGTDGEEQTQMIRNFAGAFHTMLGDKMSIIQTPKGDPGADIAKKSWKEVMGERSAKFATGAFVTPGLSPYKNQAMTGSFLGSVGNLKDKWTLSGKNMGDLLSGEGESLASKTPNLLREFHDGYDPSWSRGFKGGGTGEVTAGGIKSRLESCL